MKKTRYYFHNKALCRKFSIAATNKVYFFVKYRLKPFNQSAPIYQKALDDSGYHHRPTFTPSFTQSLNSTRTNRRRNVIWYNPPFSKNVATNVGRTFLKILDEEFPENHVFHKIFNRNTVKISYSCMPNLKQKIDRRNKSILQKTTAPPILKACSCRRPADCPIAGNCLRSSVVYQTTVTTEDSKSDHANLCGAHGDLV